MPYPASAQSRGYHDMGQKLDRESTYKPQVDLLFMPHRVEDISSDKGHRKSGTDFFLHLRNSDGTYAAAIRCENKFEEWVTGRQLFEIASVDRPRLVPGWMYTSRTAWLLSWYLSGELVALPMDEARDLVLNNVTRHQSTTARNKTYLSWSVLEDINYVVQNVEHARVIDLALELGRDYSKPRMLRGASLDKCCSVEELTQLMRALPVESTPRQVTEDVLMATMREMAAKDRKRVDNADMLAKLRWLKS